MEGSEGPRPARGGATRALRIAGACTATASVAASIASLLLPGVPEPGGVPAVHAAFLAGMCGMAAGMAGPDADVRRARSRHKASGSQRDLDELVAAEAEYGTIRRILPLGSIILVITGLGIVLAPGSGEPVDDSVFAASYPFIMTPAVGTLVHRLRTRPG